MRQNSCIARCYDKKCPRVDIEYGQECYCDLIIGTDSDIEDDSERSFKYSGVAVEACGSNKRLTVLRTTKPHPHKSGPAKHLAYWEL